MELDFSKKKLARICNDRRLMKKEYGAANADRLANRLAVLRAAPCLADVPASPPDRCHELFGDWKGYLAVDIGPKLRLIFEPNHNPLPTKPDGGLDWSEVTHVLVVEIKDYH